MSTLENIKSGWARLKEPFPAEDIEWRIQRVGKTNDRPWAFVLAYVTARAIQDRLDDVVGAENWRAEYHPLTGGLICRLSIRLPQAERISLTKDGPATIRMSEWITKEDGAPETEVEPFKGSISGAFKRVASVWGIGRYLHNLDAGFAKIVQKDTPGARFHNDKNGNSFYWLPPMLPAWAHPISRVADKSVPPVGVSISAAKKSEGPYGG